MKRSWTVHDALAPAGVRYSSMQVIHSADRGWASINNVWTCGPGSCSSARLASVLSQSAQGCHAALFEPLARGEV